MLLQASMLYERSFQNTYIKNVEIRIKNIVIEVNEFTLFFRKEDKRED